MTFAYEPWWDMFVALAAGVAVATIAVILIKQFWPNREIERAAKASLAKQAETVAA